MSAMSLLVTDIAPRVLGPMKGRPGMPKGTFRGAKGTVP